MKIVFWGKGDRGYSCLKRLVSEKNSPTVVVLNAPKHQCENDKIYCFAQENKIECIFHEDVNGVEFQKLLETYDSDVFVLAGYGQILKQNIINIPKVMCINLHGGKLPKYRGSSPLNWALINGESQFTISIIQVDSGVDTGDILAEKTFQIKKTDTIVDLHHMANESFPNLLSDVLKGLSENTLVPQKQIDEESSYYPLRFPNDGLIIWDFMSAEEVHNRIRALTRPYPCAFTFYNGVKVKLISSELCKQPYFGEPGRIYKISNGSLLVCAKDRCLWINECEFECESKIIINRYDHFHTMKSLMLKEIANGL